MFSLLYLIFSFRKSPSKDGYLSDNIYLSITRSYIDKQNQAAVTGDSGKTAIPETISEFLNA